MELMSIILFGLVVLLTHFLEGITGFGCTVLALPFCIMLVGIKTAVPTLIILAWILALYIVVIAFKDILWKEFLRIIIYVLLGLPFGIWLFSRMPEGILKRILAVFMILVSIRGLYVSYKGGISSLKIPKPLLNLVLFLGGIIHGAFGTGGPFVVIYATKAIPNKNNFRATLCLLWLSLNTVIIVRNIVDGIISPSVVNLLLWTIPFLAGGMLLGNMVHNKVKDTIFVRIVYSVLLFSGIFMFV
ncbi:MAG: sulfite exporter TauE/SafE family protein [Bacillota bacterium]